MTRFMKSGSKLTRTICPMLAASGMLACANSAFAYDDVSAPTILQWFDGSYDSMERRASDIFMAGYGNLWTPPPGRADSGNHSVGYDQYNRFDLGSAGNYTLYGSETGLKKLASTLDMIGANLHIDLVWNHNGFSDRSNNDFIKSGGYPGFWMGEGSNDGDFHGPYEGGDLNGRLSGLIDINHEVSNWYVRNPVPGYNNLPNAGTQDYWGKLANVPTEENRRFYMDTGTTKKTFYEPRTGLTFEFYEFNSDDPTAGDPIEEDARGYLMRNARWLVEEIGVDGFRIDAAKHFQGQNLDYFDAAVFDANPRKLLDGSTQDVFSYLEVFDYNPYTLGGYVRKDIDPNNRGTAGGNRDVLDFSLFGAMRGNLSKNGYNNSFYNMVYESMDYIDDHMMNGSSGVKFVNSHDEHGAELNNVAHAYTLMMPGNSIVYFNAKEFGDGRDFPKDGRGDALGGVWGNTITTLNNIRNTHGRGDYRERWIEKELFAFERAGSSVVLLSNRMDEGVDARTLRVDFKPGTRLVELTGNHDKNGNVQEVVTVRKGDDGNSYIDINFLRNDGDDQGYLIYGLAKPKSENGVELSNVASVLEGGNDVEKNWENATKRLTDLNVITADNFELSINTQKVVLADGFHDKDADSDYSIFKFDGGLDMNGNGKVDYVTPNSTSYGFEEFDVKNDGYSAADGNGHYSQDIDATKLSEGEHFITIRSYRHNDDANSPEIYEDFKKVIYIDRLPPESKIESFAPVTEGANENRKLVMKSVDMTADNMHIFMDIGANMTDSEILAMLDGNSQTNGTDRDQWEKSFNSVSKGNHAFTLVTFEQTGNYNIQRFSGFFTDSYIGAGLGDLDLDKSYDVDDVNAFIALYNADNTLFNAAADFNADGLIDLADVTLFGDKLDEVNADVVTISAYDDFASTLIPEPSALLILTGSLSILGLRRRKAC
ncbi:cytoplasmic alpha-amylase [Poriferisphaera corsica]|uniref:Cytoplasmic alpha-amylase n=1 Tax=Poriferisphaera corsica TaxID=2528020 RepID=A0A517YXH0_9BACT|nr:alpha-amylase family glycosyl hydrolase [Poriferisphaera corsica]QDU34914.1 cytoplasmic alpha-amylase [Poriferisphaera corsica]